MSDQDIKTDVALIKKDIKQIERFFEKIETVAETMSELSKVSAVQEEVLKNTAEKLNDLEERIEQHRYEDERRSEILEQKLEVYRVSSRKDHEKLSKESAENRILRNKEIMDALSDMDRKLEKKLEAQEKRIQSLENWKWYMMGMGAVVLFLATKVITPSIIG